MMSADALPFYLGCPVWACEAWGEQVYPAGTPRRDWLAWYSRTFTAIECNSTFYAVPSLETAARWAEQTTDGFHFVLKFPRETSHADRLGPSSTLDQFYEVMRILSAAERLGPAFLQLPPWFDVSREEELAAFCDRLPPSFAWAVEVRHASWFTSSGSARLDALLRSRTFDRVSFDSRALFQAPPSDAIETASQKRKPNPPVRWSRTSTRPIVRLVGRNQLEQADSFAAEWFPILEDWIRTGATPYLFTHAPDDALAPAFARRLAEQFGRETRGEPYRLPFPPQKPKQMSLL